MPAVNDLKQSRLCDVPFLGVHFAEPQENPTTMNFRPKTGLTLLLTLMACASQAQADVWKCTDAGGTVAYTNTRPSTKGCKLLSQDQPVSTVPETKRRAPAAATPSPQNFPKVNTETQRGRDQTRRQILEKELSEEQGQLDKAQATLAEQEAIRNGDEHNYQRVLERLKPFQDRVAEHQRNIEALRLEMSKLK